MKKVLIIWLLIAVLIGGCMARAQTNDYVQDVQTAAIGGWTEDAEDITWAYVSANAGGNTYVIQTSGDLTETYYAGLRFRCKQGGGYEYFIIHKAEYTGGMTQLTLFGGASGDLTDTTITDGAFSPIRFPKGFPVGEDEWMVEVVVSSNYTVSTPTGNTWYLADSSMAINIPIGIWNVSYKALLGQAEPPADGASYYLSNVYVTLSTQNNAETISALTSYNGVQTKNNTLRTANSFIASDFVSVASETTYYLIFLTSVDAVSLHVYGSIDDVLIRAVSGYY